MWSRLSRQSTGGQARRHRIDLPARLFSSLRMLPLVVALALILALPAEAMAGPQEAAKPTPKVLLVSCVSFGVN